LLELAAKPGFDREQRLAHERLALLLFCECFALGAGAAGVESSVCWGLRRLKIAGRSDGQLVSAGR
jgi:hypothetical protein